MTEKRVEYHFDERSQVTAEEAAEEGRPVPGCTVNNLSEFLPPMSRVAYNREHAELLTLRQRVEQLAAEIASLRALNVALERMAGEQWEARADALMESEARA